MLDLFHFEQRLTGVNTGPYNNITTNTIECLPLCQALTQSVSYQLLHLALNNCHYILFTGWVTQDYGS